MGQRQVKDGDNSRSKSFDTDLPGSADSSGHSNDGDGSNSATLDVVPLDNEQKLAVVEEAVHDLRGRERSVSSTTSQNSNAVRTAPPTPIPNQSDPMGPVKETYNELLNAFNDKGASDSRAVYKKLEQYTSYGKRENLRGILKYLEQYTATLTKGNLRSALEAFSLDLDKKLNPKNWRERLRYKRVSGSELVEMTELTFHLIFTAKCRSTDNTSKSDAFRNNQREKQNESLMLISANVAEMLAKKIASCSNYFRIAGGLALIVMGAALIVGAGCMIAATYGTTSPFALTVAKFGFGISSVGASYILGELIGPPLYRKLFTKEKASRRSSTEKVMKEFGIAAGTGLGAGSGVAVAASMGYGTLPATASITSTVFPSVLPTATTSLGVTGVLTGIATTAFAGVMAMGRGFTLFQDGLLMKRLGDNATRALAHQVNNVSDAADDVRSQYNKR